MSSLVRGKRLSGFLRSWDVVVKQSFYIDHHWSYHQRAFVPWVKSGSLVQDGAMQALTGPLVKVSWQWQRLAQDQSPSIPHCSIIHARYLQLRLLMRRRHGCGKHHPNTLIMHCVNQDCSGWRKKTPGLRNTFIMCSPAHVRLGDVCKTCVCSSAIRLQDVPYQMLNRRL